MKRRFLDAMEDAMWPRNGFIGLSFFALLLAGCATKTPEAPPLPVEVKNSLGTITVATESSGAPSMVTRPVSGAGAALQGAGQGVFVSLAGGFNTGQPLGAALGIALAVPAGLVGGVVGAAKSHPAKEVEQSEASIQDVLDAARPESDLFEAIRVAAARDAPQHPIVRKTDASDTSMPSDSLLVLHIADPKFSSDGRIDPDVSMNFTVQATLTAANSQLNYEACWYYVSTPVNYFALAANHGQRLSSELQRAYSTLAEEIVHDLLITDQREKFGPPTSGKAVRGRPPLC